VGDLSRWTCLVAAAAFLLAAAVFPWGSLAGDPSAPGGSVGAAASRPATASYPSEKLRRSTRAAASTMLARLDGSFRAAVRPPFVVIGNLPEARLRRLADGTVLASAEAMWRSYFRRRPTDVITILLFADGKSYARWAKKLFNDTRPPYFGYYKSSMRTMVMNIATGSGTLVHELTHALIAYDFPKVPAWFNEGLASLHEQCRVEPKRITGLVNWRLPALQKAVRAKTLRPLRELVTGDDFYGRLVGLNYAQARYFLMYAQQRGLLKKLYETLRDHRSGKDAAVKAIEKVFAAGIEKVEADFLRWVMTLRWPER
jgi:hypothetical protein